jgi:hypothetical protein
MRKSIAQNYLTTIFGILAGLPALVYAYPWDPPLTSKWTHVLVAIGGIGAVGLGVVSKAFNVHSTQAEVDSATVSLKKAA